MNVESVVPASLQLQGKVLAYFIGTQAMPEVTGSFPINHQRDGSLYCHTGDSWSQAQWDKLLTAKVDGITAQPSDELVEWMTENQVSFDSVQAALANLEILETVDPDALPLDPPDHVVISTMDLRSVYALKTYEAPPPPPEPEPDNG